MTCKQKNEAAEIILIPDFYTKLAGFYKYTSGNSMFWKLLPTSVTFLLSFKLDNLRVD